MLEKLKRRSRPSAWVEKSEITSRVAISDAKMGIARKVATNQACHTSLFPLPRRDERGVTISKGVGTFPNQVTLKIRHNNPTLGLNDVAYQREHQTHTMNEEQYERLQRQLEDSKGVLSLGLPNGMFRKKKKASRDDLTEVSDIDSELNNNHLIMQKNRRRSLPRKTKKPSGYDRILLSRPVSAHGDLIPSQEIVIGDPNLSVEQNQKLRHLDNVSRSSGHSSGTSSSLGTFSRPPPRMVVPRTLSPCPNMKMHPSLVMAPINTVGISHKGKSVVTSCGMKMKFDRCLIDLCSSAKMDDKK